jgi:hypothetical protein
MLCGIDLFTYVYVHESWHHKTWREGWGHKTWDDWRLHHAGKNGPEDDKDAWFDSFPPLFDYIPNAVEQRSGLYDWETPVTMHPRKPAEWVGMNDWEDWNCWENRHVRGDHSKDWANPGMNHRTKGKYDD